jgi:hypothetical protein
MLNNQTHIAAVLLAFAAMHKQGHGSLRRHPSHHWPCVGRTPAGRCKGRAAEGEGRGRLGAEERSGSVRRC